jgi:hypothetical protein
MSQIKCRQIIAMQLARIPVTFAWLLLLIAPVAGRAADVLNHVPGDALGFVLARNLAAVDRKAQQLIGNLQLQAVSPLAFLQNTMGLRDGLDTNGDILFAVLPPQDGADQPQFCVWLPIADYDRFIASLGGSAGQKITGITIAGEDLLVARQEKWALVMDPDQRERMKQMLDASPPPQPTLKWTKWIDTQDVAVVVLSSGVRDALDWAMADDAANAAGQAAEEITEDIFGPAEADDSAPQRASPRQTSFSIVTKVQLLMRYWLTRSPKVLDWAKDTETISVGMRLDDQGNAHAGMRVALGNDSDFARSVGEIADHGEALPALDQGDDFIVTATGSLPSVLTSAATTAYVRALIDEMKTEEHLAIEVATLERFYKEVEHAADMVESTAVFARPGEEQDGVYTNNFLAVRVASTDTFVDHAGEVMRLWNQMNRDSERGTQLIFDIDDVNIGERKAKQYSIDIAAADGSPALPEIRQAMEKLFGPGGKMRLLIVPVDDRTALLGAATPEQMAAIIETLDLKQVNDWNRDPFGVANGLLPGESDWRVFFSPHGYNQWRARKMNAITGPVFGGPLVKDFPASPPVGAAGGVKDQELWADFVVPAQTIRAFGVYRRPRGLQIQR